MYDYVTSGGGRGGSGGRSYRGVGAYRPYVSHGYRRRHASRAYQYSRRRTWRRLVHVLRVYCVYYRAHCRSYYARVVGVYGQVYLGPVGRYVSRVLYRTYEDLYSVASSYRSNGGARGYYCSRSSARFMGIVSVAHVGSFVGGQYRWG